MLNVFKMIPHVFQINKFVFIHLILLILCFGRIVAQGITDVNGNDNNGYGKAILFQNENESSCELNIEVNFSNTIKSVPYNRNEKNFETYTKESKLFFGDTTNFYDIFLRNAKEYPDVMFVLIGEYNPEVETSIADNGLPNLHMIAWEHWKARYVIGYIAGATESSVICYIQDKLKNKLYGNTVAFNAFYAGIVEARSNLFFSENGRNLTVKRIEVSSEYFNDNNSIHIEDIKQCQLIHYNLMSSCFKNEKNNHFITFIKSITNSTYITYLEKESENE